MNKLNNEFFARNFFFVLVIINQRYQELIEESLDNLKRHIANSDELEVNLKQQLEIIRAEAAEVEAFVNSKSGKNIQKICKTYAKQIRAHNSGTNSGTNNIRARASNNYCTNAGTRSGNTHVGHIFGHKIGHEFGHTFGHEFGH